jgi:hypothetical protein
MSEDWGTGSSVTSVGGAARIPVAGAGLVGGPFSFVFSSSSQQQQQQSHSLSSPPGTPAALHAPSSSSLSAAAYSAAPSPPPSLPAPDAASVAHAMSLMSSDELLDLEAEATRIQNGVRAWLLRRNYLQLKQATRALQGAIRGMLQRRRTGAGGGGEGGACRRAGGSSGGGTAGAATTTGTAVSLTGAIGGTLSLSMAPATAVAGGAVEPSLSTASSSAVVTAAAVPQGPVGTPQWRAMTLSRRLANAGVLVEEDGDEEEEDGDGDEDATMRGAGRARAGTGGGGGGAGGGRATTASSSSSSMAPADVSSSASPFEQLERMRRQADAASIIARSLKRWYHGAA